MMDVFDESMASLRTALTWLLDHAKRHPERHEAVLVGGWAVFLHNDWEKSRDIDLLVSRSVRKGLEHFLVKEAGFVKEPRRGGLKERVVKHLGEQGSIWFDFVNFEDADEYEGHPDVDMMYGEVVDCTERHDLEGVPVWIPDRTQLFIYKLKAAWDRSFRLEHGTSEDPVFERGKLAKDFGDLIALLDGGGSARGVPPVSLRRVAVSFEKAPFTRGILQRLGEDPEVRKRYPRMSDDESGRIVRRLLDLLE